VFSPTTGEDASNLQEIAELSLTLTEQQYAQLKQASQAFSAVFAEDKAEPSPVDQILFSITEQAHKEGFEEPAGYLRSLVPNRADVPMVVAGVGAGLAGTIAGLLQSKISFLASFNPAWVALVVGWLLYKFNNQWVSAFGGGILIGSIGALTYPYTAGVLGGATSTSSGSTSSGAPSDIAAALGA